MPIYEYKCEPCGRVTEALRSMAAADEPLTCEHCGSAKTGRMHSVFSAGTSSSGDMPLPIAGAGGGCGGCCGQPDACPYN